MNLKIEITEAINGYRVDISDFKEGTWHHENTERLSDALAIAENYIAQLQLLEFAKIKNAWTF